MGREITLGIHVGHDAAAAVFVDSRLAFAEEEERHTGRKAQAGCPWQAIEEGLSAVSAPPSDVRTVALTWQLSRYLECRRDLAVHARRAGNEDWYDKRQHEVAVVQEAVLALRQRFPRADLMDFPHHHAHLACAVYFAPALARGPALGIVADALGDAESLTAFSAESAPGLLDHPAVVLRRAPAQSLGFFYKRAAEAFGFTGSEAPGYLMALAGWGDGVREADRLREKLFAADGDGLLAFAAGAFDPFRGHSETAGRCFPEDLLRALGLDRVASGGDLLARAAQANAIQRLTEEYLEELVRHLVAAQRPATLFVSGGVFLNCVALGRLARALPEVDLVVCPVKKDSGAAIGAAVLADVARHGERVLQDRRRSLRLGTAVTGCEPDWAHAGRYQALPEPQERVSLLADDILEGRPVALLDGGGELGPRALGARSILARADDPDLAARLNVQVKDRYAFQPFAGAFLEGEVDAKADEFMSYAVHVKGAHQAIAGILHRDGSCRTQVVPRVEDSMLSDLLVELRSRGTPGVVLNTSLNARGEPMPRTAAAAIRTCARLGLDRIYTPAGRLLR